MFSLQLILKIGNRINQKTFSKTKQTNFSDVFENSKLIALGVYVKWACEIGKADDPVDGIL